MSEPPIAARQHWMAVLARASEAEMAALLATCPALPPHIRLRGPESGLVMLRGRAGGAGSQFNLGEMSVTRCTVRNEAGFVGHAYIQGRAHGRATLAAAIDAGLQDPARHAALQDGVIMKLAEAQAEARDGQSRRAAATRVDFFTMATMRS